MSLIEWPDPVERAASVSSNCQLTNSYLECADGLKCKNNGDDDDDDDDQMMMIVTIWK